MYVRLFKKVPYSFLPSDIEASLTLFGTASPGGDPSADASGRQQEGLHKNIFSTASIYVFLFLLTSARMAKRIRIPRIKIRANHWLVDAERIALS